MRQDAGGDAIERQDCGPGGCGPVPWGGAGGDGDYLGGMAFGLDRWTIDRICVEQLMRTIVRKIVEDACAEAPTLAGDTGDLSDCVPWLENRGYNTAQESALIYSRRYGGGGVVCWIDDGRPPEEEVDITAIKSVGGFFALPKWYLTPIGAGSTRVKAGWYGQRYGRPESYMVTPPNPGAPEAAGMDPAMIDALAGGRVFHRSRIIPFPYCDELDLRQARQYLNWNGWGPGVVEACLPAYLARRSGALKTTDILNGSHYNVLTMPNVAHAQSTPVGGQALNNAIGWIKWCLQQAGTGLPFTAVDKASTLEPKSHTLTGISDILKEQRLFLLDNLPDYTEVALFSSGGGNGLSGDSNEGQWRAYYGNVARYRQRTVWTSGTFGGGMQQAARLAMLSKDGPTGGQLDMSCRPTWPSMWQDTDEKRAATRKTNAEARAIEMATVKLTPEAALRFDTTLAGNPTSAYPGLDVDDVFPLPTATPGGGALTPPPAPGAVPASTGAPATTPATALNAIAEESAAASPAPTQDAPPAGPVQQTLGGMLEPEATAGAPEAALALPKDIAKETELARALGMTKVAFRKWVAAQSGIDTYPSPPGTRGGHRYRMGQVLAAFNASAKAKVDAMRGRQI